MYFEVTPSAFSGALTRFSKFFHEPLMNEDSTEREVKAIDHENDKNLKQDSRRRRQVLKLLADEGAEFQMFSTGNYETLWTVPKEQGIDTRNRLLDFYEKHYCAGIMQLCVLSSDGLDDLQRIVEELFSKIENKGMASKTYQNQYTQKLGKLVHIVPVGTIRQVILMFPFEDFYSVKNPNFSSALGHLVGHEGPGSLLSELKHRDLANSLSAGISKVLTGTKNFKVTISLTKNGLKNYTEVVSLFYQYIELLKSNSPLPDYIWNETFCRNKISFKFAQKSSGFGSYCTRIADRMQQDCYKGKLNEIIDGPYLKRFSERNDEIFDTILGLIKPENSFVVLEANEFEKNWPEKAGEQKTEYYYQSKYSFREFSDDEVEKWSKVTICENLKLPVENQFIATAFEINPSVGVKTKGEFSESVNLQCVQKCVSDFLNLGFFEIFLAKLVHHVLRELNFYP